MWEFISSRLDKEKKYNFGRDIRLDGIRRVHFIKSEWESFTASPNRVSNKYLAYRLFYFCMVAGILFFSVGCTARPNNGSDGTNPAFNFYLVFLTHWSIITQSTYALVFLAHLVMEKWKYWKRKGQADPGNEEEELDGQMNMISQATKSNYHTEECEVIVRVFERAPGDRVVVGPLPIMDKIIWFLFSCTTVLPLVVTIGFWGFLYSPENQAEMERNSWCSFPTSTLVHGLNACMFFIDFMVVAIPFRYAHFVYVAGYGYVYGCFSGFYELGGGPYLDDKEPYFYSFLNWHQTPGKALTALYLFIVLGGLIYALDLLGYKFRLWLVTKYKPEAKHEHEYKFHWMEKQVAICAQESSCWGCGKNKKN